MAKNKVKNISDIIFIYQKNGDTHHERHHVHL